MQLFSINFTVIGNFDQTSTLPFSVSWRAKNDTNSYLQIMKRQ